jgi:FAD synthase
MDDQGVLRGAMHFGARPTFGDTLTCEVHIIDKIITELPRSITIQPVAILRSIVHFETANNLVEQIQKDIASCRALLTDAPKKLQ